MVYAAEDNLNRQTELENCNFVKTVLMILVVLYHCLAFWKGSWFTRNPVFQADGLAFIAEWMNSFHIYGFALVSGYIFYCLKYEKGKYQRYIPFLAQKAKRLLVPFVFIAAVWAIPVNCLFFLLK